MKDCLTWPMWHTKNAFFRKMQFLSHCYTVVSYQALFRLSLYKILAVYLSGAKNVCFCTIRDFGSPTIYDRVYAYKDSGTGLEDLLRRFLDDLYDDKARFQVEYVKEPKTIEEAVFFVVDFEETR